VSLETWGWNEEWARVVPSGSAGVPARVTAVRGRSLDLVDQEGSWTAELGGSWKRSESRPTVGDWVLAEDRSPVLLLPRRSWVRRGQGSAEQVLAANVDLLFIVSGLGGDVNPRRLERYLILALEGRVEPVFILNKTDLPSADAAEREVRTIAQDHEVLRTSARHGTGISELRRRLRPGVTGALVGSSGVGKSTLLNGLVGQRVQDEAPVRLSDGRGVHTTTVRSLFLLEGGGLVIDTPGLREIPLPGGEESVRDAFPDVAELATGCRFRDCRHQSEPGCAVSKAREQGLLDAERMKSFEKLSREVERATEDGLARSRRKAHVKAIHRSARRGKGP
jgi:ribosome biogenesis GTPase